MKKISLLCERIRLLNEHKQELVKDTDKQIKESEKEVKELFKIEFKKDPDLKKALSKLEGTQQLTSMEYDEYYYQWTRFDADTILPSIEEFGETIHNLALESFREYIDNFGCYSYDEKSECIVSCIGPAIIINEDGEILDQDSNKWIAKKNQFESEKERNDFIESYMQKTGVFPWIVRVDHYGNAYAVSLKGDL